MSIAHGNSLPEKNYTLVDMQPQQFLQKLFIKYDLNHNKRISIFEFQDIMRVLTKMTGAPFPASIDVEDIFTCLDRDGDETISFSEFQQLFKSFAKLMEEQRINLKLKKEI